MSATRFIVVRHCEAQGNIRRVFNGITDGDITENGARQLDLLAAVAALRDEVAAQCATFDPDDPMVLALLAKSEAIDAELTKWTEWLHSHESTCDQGKTTP